MEKAKVGDRISFGKGIIGKVEKVNENSVIVKMKNSDNQSHEPLKTVVNHKNYKIISR